MKTKLFINESVAFLMAAHIAHYYFTQGYYVSITGLKPTKSVSLSIFTDDGKLPKLPAGLSYSKAETRKLQSFEVGTFYAHKFEFEFE